jgi:DNA repair protein RecO (recombination protein O)
MKQDMQIGFVLHTRPYRDSSLLVEYFSRESGRLSFVSKGAKGRKTYGGSYSSLLQPFAPLMCSWVGRGELKTLTGCESAGRAPPLVGRRLFSGFYVNELLVRLLHHEDPHQLLFDNYVTVLRELAEGDSEDLPLRQFEFSLLEELGYGFGLEFDGLSGEPVVAGASYLFHPEHGLVLAQGTPPEGIAHHRGEDLLQISRGDFSGTARKCAKRLMREALAAHLGGKPLKSRELFQRPS